MPTDRGEYRPMFCRILNGPDFQRLSGIARACIYPLKLLLPVTGIGVIPALAATISEYVAFPEDEVRAAIAELEADQGDGPWLRRQANVVWLVRGLEFEPTMNPNDPRHVTHVRRLVESLPTLDIVRSYKSHYVAWFGDQQEDFFGPPEGPSRGDAGTFDESEREVVSTSPSPKPTTRKHTRPRQAEREPSAKFLQAWDVYPKRPNNSRQDAWLQWQARLRAGETEDAMLSGTQGYAAYVEREGTEPRFVKQASTFYGRGRHYLSDFSDHSPAEPEVEFADQLAARRQNGARHA